MNDQLYLNSAYGTIPVTVRSLYRDEPTLPLMAEIEVDKDVHPYERGDVFRVPYTSLVHYDLGNRN
jgi:hypothetical protein